MGYGVVNDYVIFRHHYTVHLLYLENDIFSLSFFGALEFADMFTKGSIVKSGCGDDAVDLFQFDAK